MRRIHLAVATTLAFIPLGGPAEAMGLQEIKMAKTPAAGPAAAQAK